MHENINIVGYFGEEKIKKIKKIVKYNVLVFTYFYSYMYFFFISIKCFLSISQLFSF